MAERKNLAQRVLDALTGKPASRTESGFRAKITPEHERRQFRRIQAPVYCRPAGLKFLSKHEESIDVSLGGVRVYSDEELKIGDRLTMELFVKDQPSVHFDAEVAWIEALEQGAPGKFDVGLKYVHLDAETEALLAKVLE
jgi:hypothetical protein